MKDKWKKINPAYNPVLFQVFRSAIKHQHFNYSKKRIEKEFEVQNMGTFKIVCKWQNEEVCGLNMYKKIV